MSDHYHYKTPQQCFKCGAELTEFWYAKYHPGYECPDCGWKGTVKDFKTQRKAYAKLQAWNRKVLK